MLKATAAATSHAIPSHAFAWGAPAQKPTRQDQPTVLFVVDANLSIRFMNAAAGDLDGVSTSGTHFATSDSATNAKLRRWLQPAKRDGAAATMQIRFTTPAGRRLALTLMPVADMAADNAVASRCTVILLREPDAETRQALAAVSCDFGLTPAETKLLALICKGLDTVAAADRLGIAKSTARTHLQRVFEKTSTSRQSELVNFVATYVAA